MIDQQKSNQELLEKVELLIRGMEKMSLVEQIKIWSQPKKMMLLNFFYGIARGFGIAIGVTLLGAILLFILRRLVNLPLIGSYIAELIKIVQVQLDYY
jgi:hypothetical protein